MSESCDKFRDKIADRINGTLAEDQTDTLDAHIRSCADCAEYETMLKAEDGLLSESFKDYQKDIDKGEQEVTQAIQYLKPRPGERAISYVNGIINNPYIKLAAAAAIITIVAINYIKVMGWLYDVKHFMEICTIMSK